MKEVFGFAAVAAVVILVAGLVWIPAIVECNEVGGELVINAFNWPVCVPSAK